MVAESDEAVELHQGDVIVKGGVVVLRMDDDLGHGALHLVLVSSILALSSKVDDPGTGDMSWRKKNKGHLFVFALYWAISQIVHGTSLEDSDCIPLHLEAVSCSEYPLVGNKCPSTDVAIHKTQMQTGLPGPRSGSGISTVCILRHCI